MVRQAAGRPAGRSSNSEEVQKLREKIKCRNQEADEKNKYIKALHSDLQSEENKSANLRKNIRGLNEKVKNLQSDLNTAEQRTGKVQRQLKSVQARLNQATELLRCKEKELEEKNKGLRTLQSKWKSEVTKSTTSQQTIEQLELILTRSRIASNSVISQLENKLTQARQTLDAQLQQQSSPAAEGEQMTEDLRRQLDDLQEQLDQSKKLVDAQAEELKAAGLNRTQRKETTFGRKLKEMVESLNHEILQISSIITDTLTSEGVERGRLLEQDLRQTLPKLESSLSRPFLWRLSQHHLPPGDVEEDLWVQVALRAIITQLAYTYTQSWCPSDCQLSESLQGIYEGLHKSDSLNAAQWRSVTHAEVRQRTLIQDIEAMKAELRNRVALMLKILGWTKDFISTNEAIWRGIEIIAEKTMQINKSIHEDLIRHEVKLLWFGPGSEFLANYAKDDFSGIRCNDGKISCTTDLGVQITPRSDVDLVAIMLMARVILSDAMEGKSQDNREGRNDCD
ncbi:hypothetical protein AX16_002877 [Volvariella volvacea WC 439]|nr:hypothetical protein AX16_002877 [Volvariella volvacea WC 439]